MQTHSHPVNDLKRGKDIEKKFASNYKDIKKKCNLNVAGFYGITHKYEPIFEQYDLAKAGYGIWDFKIKKFENNLSTAFSGIYRNGFIAFLNYHGFFKRFRPDGSYFLLRCLNNVIEEVEPIHISDFVVGYLEEGGTDISFAERVNNYELHFEASLLLQKETIKKQCHSLFNKKFLELLPTFQKEILKDTPTECYKLFSNAVVKINAGGLEFIDYKELGKCVWKKHIVNFTFEFTADFKECHFYQFIRNVLQADNEPDRYKSFITSTGYLLHNYNPPEKGQAIIQQIPC